MFADEPTGNLDEEKGLEVIQILRDLNRQEGLTIIMVTHNMDLVASTDRVVRLVKGRVEGAETTPEPATPSVLLPVQGASDWAHPSIDPRLDPVLRKAQ